MSSEKENFNSPAEKALSQNFESMAEDDAARMTPKKPFDDNQKNSSRAHVDLALPPPGATRDLPAIPAPGTEPSEQKEARKKRTRAASKRQEREGEAPRKPVVKKAPKKNARTVKKTNVPTGRSVPRENSPEENMPEENAINLPQAVTPEAEAAGADETASRRHNRRGKRSKKSKTPQRQSREGANLPALCGQLVFSPLEEVARLMLGARREPARKKTVKTAVPICKKRMFISVLAGEQIEVGLAEDGVLLEYYLDMLHQSKIKGNIYKGVIHNIDSNLQAAFVNYGVGKNGFLQIDEVHPEYWQTPQELGPGKKFPPIQKVLRPGQEVLVQVVKEPTGNKGAFLTTWLSLAGRFLVLTPGQEQIGVSRKVADPEERTRLRELMNGIDPGSGVGVIVRTVGEGATKTTLKTDLQYLKRLWRDIRKRATEMTAPALIHQEPGLSERAVRDYLTDDVCEIWVNNEGEARNVREMVSLLFPRKKDLVHLYMDSRGSMWDHFNLGSQLDQIYAREVLLPSGGRLVFDQTEALMAIDINSGKISGKGNFEAMAFKTNMEATEAIARQLRLRDIGGQVVIDFIEMREKKHVLEVEKSLRQAMKSDRARHDVARMSSFGLLELVRQRMGSSALSISVEACPACGGTGVRRNLEWQALHELSELRERLQKVSGSKYVFEMPRELGLYLLNYKREALSELERDFGKALEVRIQI